MSSQAIGSLFVSLGLDSAAFTVGVKRIQTVSGRLRADLEKIGHAATALGKRMSVVSGAMAVAGAASIALVRDMSKAANEIAIQSKIANASTKEFQRWAAGSKKVGVEQDKLADILKDVNDRVGDFMETGGGPMADFFANVAPKVGVTAEQFKNLSGPQALQLYVDTLQKAGLNQQQMTFYMEAMASDATALIPLLLDGGWAMNAYGDAAERSGAVMSDAAIKGAKAFQDKLALLQQAAQGARNRLSEALIPVVNRFMDVLVQYLIPAMDRVVGKIEGFVQWFGALPEPAQNAVIAITAIVAALGPFLLALGVTLAAIGPVVTGIKVVAATAALLASPFALAAAAIAGAAVAIYANWESVGPWLQGVGDSIAQILRGVTEIIAGLFTGDVPRLIDGFKASWDGLRAYWSLLWDGITGVITAAWQSIVTPLTDWLGITDDIKTAWQAVESVISGALNGVVAAFDAAWGRIEPILTKLQSGWNRLNGSRDGPISSGGNTSGATGPVLPGQSTPDNMIDGVAVGTGAAGAQGAADAAAYEQGWRDRMGIHSPSKVMAQIGQYLTQGLGQGILGGQGGVDAASVQVGESMSDRFLSYFDGVANGASKLSDVFDNIKSAFARMLSDMASNLMSSGLSSILGGLMGAIDPLAGALRGAGLNAIPAFATGTANFAGGLARINERGEEIVELPSGSKVFPAGLSKRMVDDAGPSGGGHVSIGFDRSIGSLTATMYDVAGNVVARAAPELVGRSVAASKRSMNKSKAGWGL